MNLFVRDLTVIDSSYICEHRGVVGDSWILDVTMSGELNEMSMVLDFSRVKKQIKNLVDQYVDHRLLLPMKNAAIVHQASKPGYAKVDVLRGDKSLHLHCPDEAYCLVDAEAITTPSVTSHGYDTLRDNIPSKETRMEHTHPHTHKHTQTQRHTHTHY